MPIWMRAKIRAFHRCADYVESVQNVLVHGCYRNGSSGHAERRAVDPGNARAKRPFHKPFAHGNFGRKFNVFALSGGRFVRSAAVNGNGIGKRVARADHENEFRRNVARGSGNHRFARAF